MNELLNEPLDMTEIRTENIGLFEGARSTIAKEGKHVRVDLASIIHSKFKESNLGYNG